MQEKLDSMNIKYHSVQSITLERQRQCEHLENSATEKVDAIRNSSREKKQNIDALSSKLNDISNNSEVIINCCYCIYLIIVILEYYD